MSIIYSYSRSYSLQFKPRTHIDSRCMLMTERHGYESDICQGVRRILLPASPILHVPNVHVSVPVHWLIGINIIILFDLFWHRLCELSFHCREKTTEFIAWCFYKLCYKFILSMKGKSIGICNVGMQHKSCDRCEFRTFKCHLHILLGPVFYTTTGDIHTYTRIRNLHTFTGNRSSDVSAQVPQTDFAGFCRKHLWISKKQKYFW